MKMKIKDKTEDIGFITEKDPWETLTEYYGESFKDYREKWQKASEFELELDYPLQLDFELNNNCNLKCLGCSWSENKPEKVILFPLDLFNKIISESVVKGLRSLDMSFVNEPLIRYDLPEFINNAKEKGILDIAFNTNALLLNNNMSDRLLESGLTRIQFSIDAFSEEIYNKIRIGSDLKKVISNIDYFLEKKNKKNLQNIMTAASFLKLTENYNEEEKFIKFWKKKVDYIIIREYVNPFFNDSIYHSNKNKLHSLNRHITSNFKCNKPWQRFIIRANGDVLPCCNFYGVRLIIGNIYNDSIEKLWNSKKMKALRCLHKNGNYYLNNVCRECAENSTAKK